MSASPNSEALPMVEMSATETRSANRLTLFWVISLLILFPFLVLLGLTLRSAQSKLLPADLLPAERFYSILTLHGLGMVGLWFVAVMAGVCVELRKYIRLRMWANWTAFLGTLLGVVLLVVATLIGKYGPGWYFLYPLSISPKGVWQDWATYTFLLAIAILGVSWSVWNIDVLWGIARRYSLSAALSWHYITGRPGLEVPPFILIVTISIIANLTGLISAVIMLGLYGLELAGFADMSDALLMKNLIFLFGHLIVNIIMYLGVGLVYELLPEFAGRPWKNSRWVAIAWNLVLVLIIIAYFHHLYMDFAQYKAVQIIGQVASYGVAIPSAVVSVYGALALVWRARMQWSMASMMMYLGVMGWCIGGMGALIDSTIAFNTKFHNTLWVPAHFHTYFLLGVVLMILGGTFHLCGKLSGLPENLRRSRWCTALICAGGYGFVLMFYLGGANSIPRRYAQYHELISTGTWLAGAALVFITVLFVGVLIYLWETGRRCVVALKKV
ncbi:MAG TPA: cbb3-type cytochrome c oxidase subunit I [Gemmataceae bacterium]|nr:cbb3-type cytochrome c oxidase subunit I [Gemmataceae bacterium]